MIKKITNGKRKTIQGLDCYIPPEGYVVDFQTGKLKEVGIYERSSRKKDQYWERIPLPPKYKEKRREEKRIQDFNPAHIDHELEDYRADAWQKRLEGMWFMNNGKPTYITGLHYYYLNWIFIGGQTNNKGYPDYWESDRDFFYFMQYVLEDDGCFGMIFVTKRRQGKALDIETDIPTPDGFVKLKDIKEGDVVFDRNGKPCNVTFATDAMYNRDCYNVQFDDGSNVIADGEHRWLVCDKPSRRKTGWKDKKWHVETTNSIIKKGIKIPTGKEFNFQTPINGEVEYSEKELPIDPYILGLWLGDGNKSGSKISSIDSEILEYIDERYVAGHKSGGCSHYYKDCKKTGKPLRSQLKDMGLLFNKHIPEEYMTSSKEQRLELIRGLMDSDGYIDKYGRCEFSQKRTALSYQLKELLNSLGLKSKVNINAAKLYGKNCGTRTRVNFKTHLPVFKLTRKKEKLPKVEREYPWAFVRSIVSVNKVKSRPVRCIEVDSEDHTFLCTRNYIVTHNTVKSIAFLLEGLTRTPYANGGIQSKTEEDARNVVYRDGILKSFRKLPDFFKPNYYEKGTAKGILFDSKRADDDCLYGWVDYRSSTDTAYDGTKLFRYIGDEIFKTTNSDIYNRHEIVLPTLEDVNRNPYGKCLYTSTVEEMEGHVDNYIRFWQDSNQKKRHPDTGFTRSKLFHYFQPAHKSMNRDIYGRCVAKENERLIMAEREQVKGDARQFNGRVRKNPMTIEEAFRVTANNNIYDTVRLLDRHEQISWREDLYERGNFIWKDGIKDSEVLWEKSKVGRWRIRWDLINEVTLQRPLMTKPKPYNTHIYAIGCDPFSHSKTEDNYKASNGSFYVYKKRDVHDPDRSDCFVVEYCDRPPTSQIFFEDLIKTCVFFGTDALIENNRNNILDYIKYREYGRFAMKLPGRKDAGLATGGKVIGDIVDYTDSYIYTHLEKVYFPKLLKDWMNFDPNNTTRFDRAMAAGITLIAANRYNLLEKKLGEKNLHDVTMFL